MESEIYKMKKTNTNVKKVASIVGASALIVGALIGGAIVYEPSIPIIPQETIIEYVDVPVNVTVTEIVEVPVNVTEYVEVDNGNMDLILDYAYDNNGNLRELDFNDLDEDEMNEVVDRIVFVNDLKAMAVAEVKAELFDELDNEYVGLVKLDEDDMERLRIDDDADEVVIDDVDFEDLDADVLVTGSFEMDDIKYAYEALVEFKDGIVDDFSVNSVVLD